MALVVLIFEDGVLALRDTGRRLACAARRKVVGHQDVSAVGIYSAEE